MPILILIVIALAVPTLSEAQETLTVPTREELTAQTSALIELQRLSDVVQEQEQKILALEADAAASAAASEAERARVQAEIDRKQDSLRSNIHEMRLTTISSWAHSTASLQTGLQSAKAIAEIGNITLIYRPGDSAWWTDLLEYGGQALTIAGLAFAATSDDGGDQQRSLGMAAGGLVFRFGSDWLQSALRDRAKEAQELQVLIQRTAMHRSFASEVVALNTSVDSVLNLLVLLGTQADNVIDSGNFGQFRVTPALVRDYRVLIESYTVLVSQFQHAHGLAEELLNQKNASWTQEIQGNLTAVRSRTRDAIVRWRRQIIVSEGILENLEKLAQLDQTCEVGSLNPDCPNRP